MDKRWVWWVMAMVGAPAAVACGDDDGPGDMMETDSGTIDAGRAGAGGVGGAGGAGGRGGRGGSGGASGAPATTVQCGTDTCEAPAAAMGFITACCADAASSTCGTSVMGGPCGEAAPGDPRCPPLDIMGFIMLPSCCTAGQCGIDASMFGMPGCVDLATAAARAEMMGMGAGIELPEPRACEDAADAGTEDAG